MFPETCCTLRSLNSHTAKVQIRVILEENKNPGVQVVMNTSLEVLDSTFSKFCLHAQIGTQISVFSPKMYIFV
jgi:hypothetical protein